MHRTFSRWFNIPEAALATRSKLHYLTCYDGLRAALGPEAKIEAHISNRGPFQAHMSCILPSPPGSPDFDTNRIAMKLQPTLPRVRINMFPGRLQLVFPENVDMVVTFGPRVTLKELLATPTHEERQKLRGAFGCDVELFRQSISIEAMDAVKYMDEFMTKNYAPELRPPLFYWEVVAVRTKQELNFWETCRLFWYLKEHHQKIMARPTKNPCLPAEDLNTYSSVQLLNSLRFVPFQVET